MIEELYNKIDKFCNETDWSKYLTYEHALEEFIKEIVEEETKELEKENTELKEKYVKECEDVMYVVTNYSKQLTKAKEIIENLLYYVKQCTCERSNYAEIEEDIKEAEQFLSEVVK